MAKDPILNIMGQLFKAHPWHGIEIGEGSPQVVNAYIEMVPTDNVKYELDKVTGILKVDRPQVFSSRCPSLYGFIPRTHCGKRVAEFCMEKTDREDIIGDDDPLDICVLAEKPIMQGNILLQAKPIGGFRMIDKNEADDKIIAVMNGDLVYGEWEDVSDCPPNLIERLHHYFLTYKSMPGQTERRTEITHIYGRDEAHEVIKLSQDDYGAHSQPWNR